MAYKACIFDLDGVITDTAHYHFLAWKALAESQDIEFTEEDNSQLKGVGRMESLDHILAKSDRSYNDSEKQSLAAQKNDHYKTLIGDISAADLLPGIGRSFTCLKEKGWKIGLASASHNAPQVIQSLGIAHLFDYTADASKIARGKPAPDIFLDVIQAFSLRPDACIGVEDAAAGVTAIKSAGMTAIGIGDAVELGEADLVLPTPATLSTVLASQL